MPISIRPKAPANDDDPRIQRTKAAVETALVELLEEGTPLARLTIATLMKRAGVNRRTFYDRYATIENLVNEMGLNLFLSTIRVVSDADLRGGGNPERVVRAVFDALHAEKRLLRVIMLLCRSHLTPKFLDAGLRDLLGRMERVNGTTLSAAKDFSYAVAAISGAMYGLLTVWAEEDFARSTEEMSALFLKLLMPGSLAVLQGR